MLLAHYKQSRQSSDPVPDGPFQSLRAYQHISWLTISQFQSLKVPRSVKFMYFRNVDWGFLGSKSFMFYEAIRTGKKIVNRRIWWLSKIVKRSARPCVQCQQIYIYILNMSTIVSMSYKIYIHDWPFQSFRASSSGDSQFSCRRSVCSPDLEVQKLWKGSSGLNSRLKKRQISITRTRGHSNNPTNPFTILELWNPSHDAPELHKYFRSPDLKALKLWKGSSGIVK